ncbi:MAG TPA: hypothetical protein VLL25_04015 [Acidimicrobiales bacterium]|nr:hypothetical protein [Acidimicrobiales bacterium]
MAVSKLPKELRALAKGYLAKGWSLTKSGSGHVKWYAPDGHLVTVTSSTPNNAWTVARKTMAILNHYELAAVAA